MLATYAYRLAGSKLFECANQKKRLLYIIVIQKGKIRNFLVETAVNR
jgi:hypothetical protein